MSFKAIRPIINSLRSIRTLPVARQSLIRPVLASRPFSLSARRLGSGESDSALSAVLASEQNYESEAARENPNQPEFLSDFLQQGVWQIQDAPGSDDVALVRKFGSETLKITFQVSDLEDPSLANTDESGVPIDNAETEMQSPPFITCSLLLTKPATPGALSVDLEAGEEGFEITNVAMFEKNIAVADGAEGDWARRSKYMGPQFEHLDETVQDAFNAFLAERGVDESLSNFVLQYCEHKEQKDYVSWLTEVKGFVEA